MRIVMDQTNAHLTTKPSGDLTSRVTRKAAAMLARCGLTKLHSQRQGALRILCYHGVCADDVAGQPWVPSHFVSAGEFRHQMGIVRRYGPVVHLPDVMHAMADGSYKAEAAFAVTFDDVAACSFQHARPVLEELGIRASFFVSTGHVSTGRLFDGDVLNLLRIRPQLAEPSRLAAIQPLVDDPPQRKLMTLCQLRSALDEVQRVVRERLDPRIRETLRPMNWDEVTQLAEAGHEIGGHTVDHVILGRQPDQVRRRQVADSLAELEKRLNRKGVGFAYPNGGPGDFGEQDQAVLRELGVQYALATRPGFARLRDDRARDEPARWADLLALPRVCIGSSHTPDTFAWELSGLLDRRRQRQQGWL